MIRKKREIEREIKDAKRQLDGVIKGAIEREGSDNETISLIEEKLDSLRSETCFEHTIEGRICLLETTAFDEIDVILKGLSKATGKSYHMKPHWLSLGQDIHSRIGEMIGTAGKESKL